MKIGGGGLHTRQEESKKKRNEANDFSFGRELLGLEKGRFALGQKRELAERMV